MQKITIAEVKPSDGEKKPTVVTDTTGAKMSGFDTGLKILNAGDVIEAELEVKGKYTNIKSFTIVKKATQAETASISSCRDASIEAQVAAKIGGELLAAGIITPSDQLGHMTLAWSVHKLGSVGAAKQPDKTQGKPGVEELFPEDPIPSTVQELCSWAAGHGKTCTPSWICKELNVKAVTDITDFKQAYETLKTNAGWEA
jgi:hypothetical protein